MAGSFLLSPVGPSSTLSATRRSPVRNGSATGVKARAGAGEVPSCPDTSDHGRNSDYDLERVARLEGRDATSLTRKVLRDYLTSREQDRAATSR
jgi:hypothetical protein